MKQENYYFNKLPKLAQIKAMHTTKVDPNWLVNLDATVAYLSEKWKLKLGDVMEGGTENLLLEATRENGELAVLKVSLLGDSIAAETIALRAANGKGYAQLYDVDYGRGAMLLERLGKPLSATMRSVDEHIQIICSTLKKAWLKPNAQLMLPTAVHAVVNIKALIEEKWTKLGKPFSLQTLSLAHDFVEARKAAYKPENCVLVHGDAHGFNILEAGDGEYKFIDPDGLLAERGFDVSCIMRDWSEPLLEGETLELLHQRCSLLAKLTGADEVSIWQWGYLARLLIGLTLLELGNKHKGEITLEVADRVSHHRLF